MSTKLYHLFEYFYCVYKIVTHKKHFWCLFCVVFNAQSVMFAEQEQAFSQENTQTCPRWRSRVYGTCCISRNYCDWKKSTINRFLDYWGELLLYLCNEQPVRPWLCALILCWYLLRIISSYHIISSGFAMAPPIRSSVKYRLNSTTGRWYGYKMQC